MASTRDEPMEVLSLSLNVIQGDGLVAKDKDLLGRYSSSDPYVMVSLFPMGLSGPDINLGKGQVIRYTLSPRWEEEFKIEIPVMSVTEDLQFQVKIFDWDEDIIPGVVQSEHSLMGIVNVNVPPNCYTGWNNPPTTRWYRVPATSAKRASGRIQCTLQVIKSIKKRDDIAKTIIKEPKGKPISEKDREKYEKKRLKKEAKTKKKELKKEKKLEKRMEKKKKKELKKLKAKADSSRHGIQLNKSLSTPNLMRDTNNNNDSSNSESESDSSSESSYDEEAAAAAIYALATTQTGRNIRKSMQFSDRLKSDKDHSNPRGGKRQGIRSASARNLMNNTMDGSTTTKPHRSMNDSSTASAVRRTRSGTNLVSTTSTTRRRSHRQNLGPPITGEDTQRKTMVRRASSARNLISSSSNARRINTMNASYQSNMSKDKTGPPITAPPKRGDIRRSSSARQISTPTSTLIEQKINDSAKGKDDTGPTITDAGNKGKKPKGMKQKEIAKSMGKETGGSDDAGGQPGVEETAVFSNNKISSTTNELSAAIPPQQSDAQPANHYSRAFDQKDKIFSIPAEQIITHAPLPVQLNIPPKQRSIIEKEQQEHQESKHTPSSSEIATQVEVAPNNAIQPSTAAQNSPRSVGADPESPPSFYLDGKGTQYFLDKNGVEYYQDPESGGFYADGYGASGRTESDFGFFYDADGRDYFVDHTGREHYKDEDEGFFVDTNGRDYFVYEGGKYYKGEIYGQYDDVVPETGFFVDADGLEYYLDANGVEYYRNPVDGDYYSHAYQNAERGTMLRIEDLPKKDRLEWESRQQK